MGIAERWKRFPALPQDIEEALGRLTPLFEREGVLLAYLFGSTRQGQAGQDVDLAILRGDGPVFRLREAIMEALGTQRVDLVDLRSAPPVLRFEIISTGRPLYAVSAEAREHFELDTLHLYRDTAPLRRRQRKYLKERMAEWRSDVQ